MPENQNEDVNPGIRIACALESIAISLEKIANPLVPASPAIAPTGAHGQPRKHGA